MPHFRVWYGNFSIIDPTVTENFWLIFPTGQECFHLLPPFYSGAQSHTSKPPEEMIRASSLQQGRQASNLVDLCGGRPNFLMDSCNQITTFPGTLVKDVLMLQHPRGGLTQLPFWFITKGVRRCLPHAVFFNLNFKSLPKKKTTRTPSEKLIIYETKTSFMGNLSPLPPMSPPSRK